MKRMMSIFLQAKIHTLTYNIFYLDCDTTLDFQQN